MAGSLKRPAPLFLCHFVVGTGPKAAVLLVILLAVCCKWSERICPVALVSLFGYISICSKASVKVINDCSEWHDCNTWYCPVHNGVSLSAAAKAPLTFRLERLYILISENASWVDTSVSRIYLLQTQLMWEILSPFYTKSYQLAIRRMNNACKVY
jgi:hypothetical protein